MLLPGEGSREHKPQLVLMLAAEEPATEYTEYGDPAGGRVDASLACSDVSPSSLSCSGPVPYQQECRLQV